VLPNGLRVLLFPHPSANTAQLSVAVEYGANYDSGENAGAAHFIEHMIAGGSTRRIQLSRSVESSGGIIDFYTDHEYTMSMADILPEKLPESAQILSDLLFDTSFEEEKFCSEQKIIINELAEVSDDPYEKVNESLLECMFKTHPVKRPIGGYPKNINSLSLNQLVQIHNRHYSPQNMILILTGNLPQKNVESALEKFSINPYQDALPRTLHPLEVAKPKREVIKKKAGITQTYLSIGARTVPSNHPDAPTLDLLNMLLGGGASSRLFIELREERALTYDITSVHSKGLDYGYFNVTIAVKNKNLTKAKETIFNELSKLRNEKVSEFELSKGKRMITGGILRGIDSPDEAPDILTYMEIQFNNEKSLVAYIDKLKAVSSDDLMKAANTYLQEDSCSTAILTPK
jgi:predicted Zn-dependent peptidase